MDKNAGDWSSTMTSKGSTSSISKLQIPIIHTGSHFNVDPEDSMKSSMYLDYEKVMRWSDP